MEQKDPDDTSAARLKKIADILLAGGTMMREPCPYCGGVRVIKDGNALCSSCGREPDESVKVPKEPTVGAPERKELEARLVELSGMLSQESNAGARDALLKEISATSEAIAALE